MYQARRNPRLIPKLHAARWDNPEILGDYLRLIEKLERDPRSADIPAVPQQDDDQYPDTWSAPFSNGARLTYHIIEEENAFEPLHLYVPSAD
jgi:hypothetical protein